MDFVLSWFWSKEHREVEENVDDTFKFLSHVKFVSTAVILWKGILFFGYFC